LVVLDLYSKRRRRALGEAGDVYSYDDVPRKLRVQVVHLLNDTLGTEDELSHETVEEVYKTLVEAFRKEYGMLTLTEYPGSDHEELIEFFLNASSSECLDIIEIAFRVIDRSTRSYDYLHRSRHSVIADDAISELNTRFKESGLGYQFVDRELIRVDSELLHAEAVKPALHLLNTKDYAGPHDEFLSAYEHFREGNNKEALNDCLKAFESTMKAICDKRGWEYKPGDGAKALIDILFEKGLVPPFWQNQFASLRSLLESSVPTGRNKLSGHGQGATPTKVPDHITAYMLHMTASTLVFLTVAEKELPTP
jgi:hypothetical protein